MGDIVGMVEQVAGKVNEQDAMRSMKRMQEGKFDFTDFLDQMKMIQNLGPLEGLLGMMPGFSKIKKQLPGGALDTSRLKRTEAIVLSMTLEERRRPEIIKGSRRQRIAAGSGTSLMEVNQLIKQFGEMRKMMKSPHKMKSMMNQMGGCRRPRRHDEGHGRQVSVLNRLLTIICGPTASGKSALALEMARETRRRDRQRRCLPALPRT